MAELVNYACSLSYGLDMVGAMTSVLDHITARKAGALGGLFASGVQFWSSTLDDFITAAFSLDFIAVKLLAAFLIGSAGYAFFGGLFAYFLQDRTRSRLAWFLAGAMATTTGVNAIAPAVKWIRRVDISIVSTAYAEDQKFAACDDIRNFTIFDGLAKFLGIRDSGYRVIIGSVRYPSDADALIKKIKLQDPNLPVSIGERAPCNNFYPVTVGPNFDSLSEAKKVQTRIKEFDGGGDAYISYRVR